MAAAANGTTDAEPDGAGADDQRLDIQAHLQGWRTVIHRARRCDLSLFHLGLDVLDYFLIEGLTIDIDFRLPRDLLFS